jgi:hypothetical protein
MPIITKTEKRMLKRPYDGEELGEKSSQLFELGKKIDPLESKLKPLKKEASELSDEIQAGKSVEIDCILEIDTESMTVLVKDDRGEVIEKRDSYDTDLQEKLEL